MCFVHFSLFLCFKLYFVLSINNAVIVKVYSKGTKAYIHMSLFSPNSLPARLPQNTEQGSPCCTQSKCSFSSLWSVLCVNVSFLLTNKIDLFFLIVEYSWCTILLLSAVYQTKSVIHVHISTLFGFFSHIGHHCNLMICFKCKSNHVLLQGRPSFLSSADVILLPCPID